MTYATGDKPVNVSLAFLYYTANKFRPVQETNNEFINEGLISSEKWFALPLLNDTNEEIRSVLEFIISGVNAIECYTVNDIQQINYIPSSLKPEEQSVQSLLSRSVTFNITIRPQEKNLLLIHTINKGQMLYFPSDIYTLNYFREFDNYKNNYFGIFQGNLPFHHFIQPSYLSLHI